MDKTETLVEKKKVNLRIERKGAAFERTGKSVILKQEGARNA